jgi:hypothetical protein
MESPLNAICTVIAANYLPQALTLEESVQRFNPNDDFFVLIVDSLTSQVPVFNHAKVLIGSDLLISEKHFKDICSNYDLFEASTAIKPSFFKTLLAKGYETVTFLDPDTQLFHSIDSVFELSKKHSIILTPHRISPVASGAVNQSEESFLRYGTFNLGFISMSQNAIRFLDWWEEKLHWSCRRYSGDTVYTDQKWIDLVPSYFDFFSLRNEGYNLAPWNLDERPLQFTDSQVLLAGSQNLVFIHYSQMSSTLARGENSNLWDYYQEGQVVKEDSLNIAKKLTLDYSKVLLRNKDMVKSLKLSTMEWPNQSFHLRAHNIRNSRLSHSSSFVVTVILRAIDPFVRKLERSDTFNSVIDGIAKDCRRLIRKFGSSFRNK